MNNTCEICGKSCFEVPLYRHNKKGEVPAIWRCEEHLKYKPDPTSKEICEIILNK